jgi:hypothetical protein
MFWVVVTLCLSHPILGARSDVSDTLTKMFRYANSGDIKSLELMQKDVNNNKTLVNAYIVALYVASPDRYAKEFVSKFPVDYSGIMYDIYDKIELPHLTPKFLYSFDALGAIADHGDRLAIEKIALGLIHSDGIVSEEYCDNLQRVYGKYRDEVSDVLKSLSADQQKQLERAGCQLDSSGEK